MLSHHRTVQIEIDSIDRKRRAQIVDDHPSDRLIRFFRHLRRRHRARTGERHDLPAKAARLIDEARIGQVRFRIARQALAAPNTAERPGRAKRLQIRPRRRERIRLMKEEGDRDAQWLCHERPPNSRGNLPSISAVV